ncbi:cytochrome C [Ideonella sp.]|uniref:cytochrome C n=1 Tax=Ideonella sp. TaxID=1929293 RepID=UPI0035B0CA4A
MRTRPRVMPWCAVPLALGALLLAGAAARADGDSHRAAVPLAPAYVQECGACHVAYSPAWLPPRSWQRLMGGLDRHFGSDASVEPATQAALAAWLDAASRRAGRVREEPPQDRLTRSARFERQHDEVPASVWALPSVKTPANCAVCHPRAAEGRFDDDELRLPAGADPRLRRAWH